VLFVYFQGHCITKNIGCEKLMFKAKLESGKFVKDLFESIDKIVSESRLIASKEGFILKAMDGSHICLMHLNISKNDCINYECDQTYELGLNFEDLSKIFKRSSDKYIVELVHNPKEKNMQVRLIKVKSEKVKKQWDQSQIEEFKRENPKSRKKEFFDTIIERKESLNIKKFSIALIDIDIEEINMESLHCMEFSNEFIIEGEDFYDINEDASIFSEVLQLECDPFKVTFSTEGSIGDYSYAPLDIVLNKASSHSFRGSYAIQFIKSILNARKLTQKPFQLSIKEEAPLLIKISILSASALEYYLAPRVESENDRDEEREVKKKDVQADKSQDVNSENAPEQDLKPKIHIEKPVNLIAELQSKIKQLEDLAKILPDLDVQFKEAKENDNLEKAIIIKNDKLKILEDLKELDDLAEAKNFLELIQ